MLYLGSKAQLNTMMVSKAQEHILSLLILNGERNGAPMYTCFVSFGRTFSLPTPELAAKRGIGWMILVLSRLMQWDSYLLNGNKVFPLPAEFVSTRSSLVI